MQVWNTCLLFVLCFAHVRAGTGQTKQSGAVASSTMQSFSKSCHWSRLLLPDRTALSTRFHLQTRLHVCSLLCMSFSYNWRWTEMKIYFSYSWFSPYQKIWAKIVYHTLLLNFQCSKTRYLAEFSFHSKKYWNFHKFSCIGYILVVWISLIN